MGKLLLYANFLIVFSCALGSTAMAQIVTFDFAGESGNQAIDSSNYNDAKLFKSFITRGSGVTAGANSERFNSTGWNTSTTIDINDYLEFTITPNARKKFTISDIMVQHQRSATGPKTFVIRTSLDGYAANASPEVTIADVATTLSSNFSLNLPTQNQPITLRIYGYNAEGSTGSWGPGDGAGNDIVVNGTAEIDFYNNQTSIISFALPQQTGPATINPTAHTVSVEVAYGTSVTALVPTITLSEGATILPSSAATQDFTLPITYNVTAEDGITIQPWAVTVLVSTVVPSAEITNLSPANKAIGIPTNAKFAVTFDRNIQKKTGNIRIFRAVNDEEIATISVADVTISGAQAEIAPATPLETGYSYYILFDRGAIADMNGIDFSALSIDTKWQFTTVMSSEATLTSTVYAVNSTANTIINVPNGEILPTFKGNLRPSEGATFKVYQADGTTLATDLQTNYKVAVTAQDGVTKKEYIVTIATAVVALEKEKVNVYPNPFGSEFTITAGNVVTRVVISNMLGQRVMERAYSATEISVPTTNLRTGVYLVTINFEDGTTTTLRMVKR